MAERTCSIEGCNKPAEKRGWCGMHYARWRRHGDPLIARPGQHAPLSERFWRMVERGPDDACWPWQGSRNRQGYGFISPGGRGVPLVAHRVAWELVHGPIPAGKVVRHYVCDNPPCCNVAHLRLGTGAENNDDKMRKGRMPAKLTAAQVDEIRARHQAGGVLQRDLAAEYGVSKMQVSRILRGQRWKGY